MKTAISIPDRLFRESERLAKRLKISRSELYARALASYVAAEGERGITEALDKVYAKEASALDPVLSALQAASLPRDEW
jgi:metal-responsive CopG/Arc/MetJ family transcriptional regulator